MWLWFKAPTNTLTSQNNGHIADAVLRNTMIRDMDKNLEESNEYSFASMTKVQVKAIQYAPSLFWEQRLNASCPRINATSVERTNIQADSTKVRPKAKKKIEPTKKNQNLLLFMYFLSFIWKRQRKKNVYIPMHATFRAYARGVYWIAACSVH